jgi:(carboxyethyl)arginine beta-lactam-synthase
MAASTLPPIAGFAVRIGRAAAPAGVPRLAAAGRRAPVAAEAAGLTVAGFAVTPAGSPVAGLASDVDVAVLLAGELYNRDELATALGEGGGTDAGLVLACFQRYGVNAFRLFDGRFAAVVVTADRVVLATDHAASVPLYVRASEADLAVATEMKALAAGPQGHRPHRVAAGTARVFQRFAGGLRPTQVLRTWIPPYHREILAPDAALAAVRERLTTAVRARLAGPDAPTVVLSGGIDSGAVAALATEAVGTVRTVSLGTDAGDEFAAARAVARHLDTDHTELNLPAGDLVDELPWAVAAAEIDDPDILEYLLPLVALYRRLPGPPRRILTGYGADIPLGGMHRDARSLERLDEAIADDMSTYDGLNELSPVLSGIAGHWSTHPYWGRAVLDLLTALEPGLKRRHGRDKWVLREALSGRLPRATVERAKLGIHEGSGLTSAWSRMLLDAGTPAAEVPQAKRSIARRLHAQLVLAGAAPDQVQVEQALAEVAR